jgi:hypothetical protein
MMIESKIFIAETRFNCKGILDSSKGSQVIANFATSEYDKGQNEFSEMTN